MTSRNLAVRFVPPHVFRNSLKTCTISPLNHAIFNYIKYNVSGCNGLSGVDLCCLMRPALVMRALINRITIQRQLNSNFPCRQMCPIRTCPSPWKQKPSPPSHKLNCVVSVDVYGLSPASSCLPKSVKSMRSVERCAPSVALPLSA